MEESTSLCHITEKDNQCHCRVLIQLLLPTTTTQVSEHFLIEQLISLESYAPSVFARRAAELEGSTCVCRITKKCCVSSVWTCQQHPCLSSMTPLQNTQFDTGLDKNAHCRAPPKSGQDVSLRRTHRQKPHYVLLPLLSG